MTEKKHITCPKCGGTGSVQGKTESGKAKKIECPQCKGEGKIEVRVFMKPAA